MAWDFVVVGGGIAGVSVAAGLTGHGSVLLVEAEPELARHTTGRSAAIYLPSYGGPVVRALTTASRAGFTARSVDAPLLRPRPTLWLATTEDGAAAMPPAPAVSAAEALALCPVLRPGAVVAAAVDSGTMDVDAMGLHQSYVRELRAGGGEVRTGARVTALGRDGSGWAVGLGGDTVRAGVVVNAAGAWADELAVLAGVPALGLRPLRRTVAVAAAAAVDPAWPLVAEVTDDFYFRPEGTGILLSPADETPSAPVDARPVDVDVALALDRVNTATTLGLRSVRHSWAGLRTFAADREPVVGELPGHPGFAFVAGQGGYGIQMAPALAEVAVAVITGGPVTVDPAPLSPARLRSGAAINPDNTA
ncbi:Sarcosine oxidase beta subunit [Actinokineospora spheciospongiae]|uniref:Sarcosine oxidase beta subunit n=1 Tax=Actinokineospora spheciospongiae TaxID=909613 RepID=W7IQM5_9PSEU|nr:FAD-binding oxidoreductase [Actinokineospora spheciospongiae]EWC58831.1 Sarcosine oxidase beta subunit [Actinokineospora spheciospongiae]PWW58271.1 D-arginine dehydrogenase [Actinokineospora spheciospongiae]